MELDREPDCGDLLLVLASAPDTLAAEAISTLGVDPDRLVSTLDALRADRSGRDRYAQIERVRQQKEHAIERGEIGGADRLRVEEGYRTRQLRADHAESIDRIRARLRRVSGSESAPDA